MKKTLRIEQQTITISSDKEFVKCSNCEEEFVDKKYVLIPFPYYNGEMLDGSKISLVAVCLDCMDEYFEVMGGFNAIVEENEED